MAVLIEAISVVIRRQAVDAKFSGGIEALTNSFPNGTACRDADLIRVGFMAPDDADAYIASLEAGGLRAMDGDMTADMAVVIQGTGPARPSPWLEFRNANIEGMKLCICWLSGKDPGDIILPYGWKYESSMSARGGGFIPVSAIGERYRFLRWQDGVEVYLDLQTKKEVYSGRPKIEGDSPPALRTQILRILQEVWAIEKEGSVPRKRWWKKNDPRYARLNDELLPEIERLATGPARDMASAHFTWAVMLRLLDRRPEAEELLRKANELDPDNVDVLRDLVRLLGEQGRPKEALTFARHAVALSPDDPSSLGNLAACLMDTHATDEAMTIIKRALDLDPDDKLNQAIHTHLLNRS